MAKIMLVEDDNNLREIYEARLLAEGYEIVSAKDGEEALALAVKERPDLIISDVMMPKISGFDMLDILRSTAETKNTKVIMMTALSQAEDKARADKLGADRYLVKSQVTLEDVAKVAHDVLSGDDQTPSGPLQDLSTPQVAPQSNTTVTTPPSPQPAVIPSQPSPSVSIPVTQADTSPAPAQAPVPPAEPTSSNTFVNPFTQNATVPAAEPVASVTAPPSQTSGSKVVEQTEKIEKSEPAKSEETLKSPEDTHKSETSPVQSSSISEDLSQTTAAEEAAIESQINAIFSEPAKENPEVPATPPPGESSSEKEIQEVLNNSIEAHDSPESSVTTIEVASAPSDEPEPAAPTTTVATSEVQQTAPVPNIPVTEATSTPMPSELPKPAPSNEVGGQRVIQPLNDIKSAPDLNELLKKENAKEPVPPPTAATVLPPPAEESQSPAKNDSPGSTVSPNDIAL